MVNTAGAEIGQKDEVALEDVEEPAPMSAG